MIAVLSPLKSVPSAEYGTAALRTTYTANGTEATPLPWTVDATVVYSDKVTAYSGSQTYTVVGDDPPLPDFEKTYVNQVVAQIDITTVSDGVAAGTHSLSPYKNAVDWVLKLGGSVTDGPTLYEVLKFAKTSSNGSAQWDITCPAVNLATFANLNITGTADIVGVRAGSVYVTSTAPTVRLVESDQAVDTQRWDVQVNAGVVSITARNDAGAALKTPMRWFRTGGVSTMTGTADPGDGNLMVGGTKLGVNGTLYTWPAADAAGVLTSNGSGTLSWASTVALGGAALSTWADSTATPALQVLGTDVSGSTVGIARFVANSGNPKMFFAKSRGATVGDYTIVQTSDTLGSLEFFGSDGSDFSRAALIAVTVDGTPAANVMPGRIAFYTHNSSGVLTQALDIRADQTATFAKSVSINGAAYTWPTANAAGVLTNNGSGTLTWAAAGGGGISDAPNDGKLYVRKSLAWADLSAESATVAKLTVGTNGTNTFDNCLIHGSYAEAQVANSRVHGLGTYTVLGSEFRPQYTELTAQGQTTSATPVAIILGLPVTISGGLGNIGGTFQVQVFGFNHTDSDQIGGYMITGAFRSTGGNFAIVGTNTLTAYESNTAWACTVTDSGGGLGLQVNVTGAASKTVNWVVYARILHVRQVS